MFNRYVVIEKKTVRYSGVLLRWASSVWKSMEYRKSGSAEFVFHNGVCYNGVSPCSRSQYIEDAVIFKSIDESEFLPLYPDSLYRRLTVSTMTPTKKRIFFKQNRIFVKFWRVWTNFSSRFAPGGKVVVLIMHKTVMQHFRWSLYKIYPRLCVICIKIQKTFMPQSAFRVCELLYNVWNYDHFSVRLCLMEDSRKLSRSARSSLLWNVKSLFSVISPKSFSETVLQSENSLQNVLNSFQKSNSFLFKRIRFLKNCLV